MEDAERVWVFDEGLDSRETKDSFQKDKFSQAKQFFVDHAPKFLRELEQWTDLWRGDFTNWPLTPRCAGCFALLLAYFLPFSFKLRLTMAAIVAGIFGESNWEERHDWNTR
jgi:hypothetical protein